MIRTTTSTDRPSPSGDHNRRILLLVHRVPYPPDKGDRIRSYHLLEHLARMGEVDLAFLTDEAVGGKTLDVLQQLCRRMAAVPVSRSGRWARALWSLACGRSLTEGLFDSQGLRDLVGSWLAETTYDSIVVFSSGVLRYVLDRGLERHLIVDLVDVDSQKWLDYATHTSGPKAVLFRLEGRRVRALERAAMDCRAVILATEPEANIFRTICPIAHVEAISNGVDLDHYRPVSALEDLEAGGCVFVGQLDYRANIQGLEWFCREIWPLVRARVSDASFRIVGRNPVAAVRRLAAVDGVVVVGPVADVRPELAAARIVVIPLLVARGVQNKVLEAMAMGKAVVASPIALDGLGIRFGQDAVVASTPDHWCQAIVGLWQDHEKRVKLGRAARYYVETSHQWEFCLKQFNNLLNEK